MADSALSEAALAEVQAKLMNLLAEGADVATIRKALAGYPELAVWLEWLDPRAVETAGVLVKKWGRRTKAG